MSQSVVAGLSWAAERGKPGCPGLREAARGHTHCLDWRVSLRHLTHDKTKPDFQSSNLRRGTEVIFNNWSREGTSN